MAPEEFARYVADKKKKLQQVTAEPVQQKEINYGQQLRIEQEGVAVTVAFYNGKKGLKIVWGGKESPLRQVCEDCLSGYAVTSKSVGSTTKEAVLGGLREETLTLLAGKPGFDGYWAGSDESGKGDFLGPLVVAAVAVREETARQFLEWGIRDSKTLTDDKIHTLAEKIREHAAGYSVLTLPPKFYNQRYAELKAQKQNLNHLLAHGHVTALAKVLKECPDCHFALVDQFTRVNTITRDLEGAFPGLTVYQQPRGEQDMAVAAASILARDQFVQVMQQLSEAAGFALPKGGGAQATRAGKKLLEKFGAERLGEFAKLHFANAKEVLGK